MCSPSPRSTGSAPTAGFLRGNSHLENPQTFSGDVVHHCLHSIGVSQDDFSSKITLTDTKNIGALFRPPDRSLSHPPSHSLVRHPSVPNRRANIWRILAIPRRIRTRRVRKKFICCLSSSSEAYTDGRWGIREEMRDLLTRAETSWSRERVVSDVRLYVRVPSNESSRGWRSSGLGVDDVVLITSVPRKTLEANGGIEGSSFIHCLNRLVPLTKLVFPAKLDSILPRKKFTQPGPRGSSFPCEHTH